MLHIYNTLSRTIEEFQPIYPPKVGMYTCGMTVYDYAHIGHGRKYVMDDVLRRLLTHAGFTVTHVQNVTDVGHLSSDADTGEDKLEKGAVKFGKTVWEVAQYFTDNFYETMEKLNILRPTVVCKATDHIPEQIQLVKTLVEKGYAYDTPEAVYFDVSKFPAYGKLFGQDVDEKKTAVREEVQTGQYKKNPIDFALWFKRVGRFSDHAMHWDSPWGDGFPGWHIECSAMSMKYLGESFDIHTGGIDHIPVHHPNEIAQSEAATGKQFVKYWVHCSFLMVDGRKMSKSLGNLYRIEDVLERKLDPLALRYLYLTAHYRKPLNFTWEALTASNTALFQLRQMVSDLPEQGTPVSSEEAKAYQKRFYDAAESDLNFPQAIAVVWEMAKSKISAGEKKTLFIGFDEVLGFRIFETEKKRTTIVPEEITKLLQQRNTLRSDKLWKEADAVRAQIEAAGYIIVDSSTGTEVKKK